jgi:multidrug efflux pump subunit AcrA (membrane-fusion protein)
MSEAVSPGRDAAGHGDVPAAAEAEAAAPRRAHVRWVLAAGLVVVAAGALAVAWSAGAFSSGASAGNGGLAPPATQPVTRQNLSSQTPVNATLGYAGSYTVLGHSGTLTWLPSPGQVMKQGQVLYKTDNGSPVVLLYGSVPAWRTLDPGTTGADVSQLNHDLVALGDASSPQVSAAGWDYFSLATQAGVQKLQAALGTPHPPGSLSPGSFAFEPGALRVATVTGGLGGPASGPVLTATSTRHVVTIALDASQQGEVRVGDAVTIALPDGSSTPGRVSSVGAVASVPSGSAGSASGSDGDATIPVMVTLTDPSAAGSLDQAPVTVNITTATVSGVLVVPVGALLAQSSGGYAVEVAGAGNTRRLVPVTVGIFDDAGGLVQVTGALTPGEQVVVPSV